MTENNETNRDERALDALIIAAFLDATDLDEEQLNKKKLEGYLTEEDKQALDALGPDLVRQITSGKWEASHEHRPAPALKQEIEEDLAVSINRGNADNELSPEAREEIEKNIAESEQEDQEGEQDN